MSYPSAEAVIAEELRRLRKEADVPRERVAQAIGVSAKTIERWEKSGRLGKSELAALRAYYQMVIDGVEITVSRTTIPMHTGAGKSFPMVGPGRLDNDVPRETPEPFGSARPPQSRVVGERQGNYLPRKLEIMALDFEKEALEADADEYFMQYARSRLRDPALFEMYAGGHDTRALTPAEQIDDYRAVINDLRRILSDRQKRFARDRARDSGKLAPE